MDNYKNIIDNLSRKIPTKIHFKMDIPIKGGDTIDILKKYYKNSETSDICTIFNDDLSLSFHLTKIDDSMIGEYGSGTYSVVYILKKHKDTNNLLKNIDEFVIKLNKDPYDYDEHIIAKNMISYSQNMRDFLPNVYFYGKILDKSNEEIEYVIVKKYLPLPKSLNFDVKLSLKKIKKLIHNFSILGKEKYVYGDCKIHNLGIDNSNNDIILIDTGSIKSTISNFMSDIIATFVNIDLRYAQNNARLFTKFIENYLPIVNNLEYAGIASIIIYLFCSKFNIDFQYHVFNNNFILNIINESKDFINEWVHNNFYSYELRSEVKKFLDDNNINHNDFKKNFLQIIYKMVYVPSFDIQYFKNEKKMIVNKNRIEIYDLYYEILALFGDKFKNILDKKKEIDIKINDFNKLII